MVDPPNFTNRAAKSSEGLLASLILSAAVVLILDPLSSVLRLEESFTLWIVAAVMFFIVALFIGGSYGAASALNIAIMGAGIAIGTFVDAAVAEGIFGKSRNLWPLGIVLFWVIGLIPILSGFALGRLVRSRRNGSIMT